MKAMPIFVLAAFSAVSIWCLISSLSVTIRHYRALPLDVPDHFDGYGEPDAYGPRPMIFVTVFAQAILVAIFGALLVLNVKEPGPPLLIVMLALVPCTLLIWLTNMQRQIVAVAQGKIQRLENLWRGLLIVLAEVIVAIAVANFVH